ncbi:MAG TPA: DUF2141 domain-containing protein [Acetobacteraceae bacterium]|nr:DUF2141 domain-containing protein [Acetobacteraceae bacterium]
MRGIMGYRGCLAGLTILAWLFPFGALWQPAQARPQAVRPAPPVQTPPCNPAAPHQVRLRVAVSGMHSTQGHIIITIYPDDAVHFLDGAYRVARARVPVALPETQVCIVVPAPGGYAVALFHDENDDGHFDTTLLGLPAKGFGFSRNPTLFLGPPRLDQVKFDAHYGDNEIAVHMKYF